GALVGLGEHDVEPDEHHTVLVEELLQQPDYLVAAPGPATERARVEAAFVDVQYDHPIVDRARHGQPQPIVVDDVFEPGNEADLGERCSVGHEHQHYQAAESDTAEV